MDPSNIRATEVHLSATASSDTEGLSRIDALWSRLAANYQLADALAVVLLVVTLLLRMLWLNVPATSEIFDETFYVNSARVMLGWPVPEGAPYADSQPGFDPNSAHVPLAKAMMAGSMLVFGDTPLGWRLPSVIMGMLAIVALYLLVRRLTQRPWLALFATFIFSFDNLVFVHSRIATLDIFMVGFMLIGVYAYVVRRPELAGVAMALSALAKINGIFGIVAIIAFEVARFVLRSDIRAKWRQVLADNLLLSGSFLFVFLLLLWGLDRYFSTFQSPLDHLVHVYNFGVSLSTDNPQGIASQPWQWLLNDGVIPYFKTALDATGENGEILYSTPVLQFTGQMNLYIITMLPVTVAYLLHSAFKKRDDLSLLMLALGAATFAQPLSAALLFHRISYIFYFLPVLPALCVGIAYFLLDSRLPRLVPLVYTAAILFGFAATFPFRMIP